MEPLTPQEPSQPDTPEEVVDDTRPQIRVRSRKRRALAWAGARVGYAVLAAVLVGGLIWMGGGGLEDVGLVEPAPTTTTTAPTATTLPETTTTTTAPATTTTLAPSATTTTEAPSTTTTTVGETTTTTAPEPSTTTTIPTPAGVLEVTAVCSVDGWYRYEMAHSEAEAVAAELFEDDTQVRLEVPAGSWALWSEDSAIEVSHITDAGVMRDEIRAAAGVCEESGPDEVSVDVRNGNGIAFQAARYASRIRALGYEATSGNWSNFGVAETFITVSGAERSHAENLVLRILGEVEVRSGAGFSVVLGADAEPVNS